jgi:hypothetical protein
MCNEGWMSRWLRHARCLAGISWLIVPTAAFGIALGQADDFQAGGLANWSSGGGTAQTVVPNGGPTGAGDMYMQLTSSATASARLLGLNASQWTGDFLDSGVTAVAMDLLNLSTIPLSMRIGIREGTGNASTPGYVTTTAFSLPADNLWHHAVFPLNTASLTGINSPAALSADLLNVKEFRLLDASTPTLIGDPFSTFPNSIGSFGVDNITAVPEPNSVVLLALGTTIAATQLKRQRHGKSTLSPGDDRLAQPRSSAQSK